MFPELDRVTDDQEAQLIALAGRLDAIGGGELQAAVTEALADEEGPAVDADATTAMVRRLTVLRLQIMRVALHVDEQEGTPRAIAEEISEDFEQRRNRLPIIVHDRAAGDVEAFGELREDAVLRYVSAAQHDALASIAEMLDAVEPARGSV